MAARREVVIAPTGTANIASVRAGFDKIGVDCRMADGADDVVAASLLVLPGVGAFGAAMAELHTAGLVEVLTARITAGRPTLCVCLGLQLLAAGSRESPGVQGLDVLPGVVGRFSDDVRAPHFGWNAVTPEVGCRYLVEGYAYFANSYRLTAEQVPAGWRAALTPYDGQFVAALERDGVLACQFHPELSGRWGIDLLRRWTEDACV